MGVAAFALVLLAAGPAFAQNGNLAGRVITQEGKPMGAVPVTLETTDGKQTKRTVTDNQGEWVVTGLPGGSTWTITVVWNKLSGRVSNQTVKPKETLRTPQLVVSEGGLEKAKAGVATSNLTSAEKEATDKKNSALSGLLKEADAAVAAGSYDEGIEKFLKVAKEVDKCAGCYVRIGDAYMKKKDFPNAEKAFLQAIEFDPKMPEPYNALGNMYNDMKRFDDAAKMMAKAGEVSAAAGGAADPASLYNQGIVFWNQGKGAEAQPFFEKAIAANPKMADAHYFLGMSLVNQGKLPQAKAPFTEYLKLDPKGQYAAQVAELLKVIK
jgi:tetratricopeptide (TPR) repeat protein